MLKEEIGFDKFYGDRNLGIVNIDGSVLIFTPQNNLNATVSFIVTAYDDNGGRKSQNFIFDIQLNNENI